MPKALIYKPSKTAMQSGRGRTKKWVLEFVKMSPLKTESLMGWVSSSDMNRQVQLNFATAEEAIAYAQHHGLEYTVRPYQEKRLVPKNYASNFI